VIEISPSAIVSPLADIEDSVRGTRIIIGDDVRIDAFVKIKPVGGAGDVVIGRGSYINAGTVIYSGNGVTIGCDVLIAANCTIVGSDHQYRSASRTIKEQRFAPSRGGVVIEDDAWLGAGATVLEGARLGRGCILGAMSMARGELEAYGVYAGIPATLIGRRE
jgi:acetyltransferase-like isoleucine patch superfamily enzyme